MTPTRTRLLGAVIVLALLNWTSPAADDILLTDFEGADYGTWKITGKAFGPGPAKGTLPNQMPVEGFQGKERLLAFRSRTRQASESA